MQFELTEFYSASNQTIMKFYFRFTIVSIFICLCAVLVNAQTFDFLDINNIKARINSSGDLFTDMAGFASFEVPKGSGKSTIFSSNLWIGGKDDAQNLKGA